MEQGPVRLEHRDAYSVARVQGEVDVANVGEVETALRLAVEGSRARLVLDLSEVQYLDSAGVRALFAAVRAAGERGLAVRVALPSSSPLMRVLEVASFASSVRVYPSVEEAATAEA